MDLETLRLSIYRGFASDGHTPTATQLAAACEADPHEVDAGLNALADQRHVVLDQAGNVVMAHPFSSIPLGFSVMGADTLWWGGCAWDSFAIPHLLTDEIDVLVATRCPGCDAALAWVVNRDAPPAGEEVAHFLVPAGHIWDDVVHSCSNQRLFCSTACVDTWLTRHELERGYEMDLPTLWRLARGWYAGRLDAGYERRDPATAATYLREVGLRGAFWGIDD